MWNIKNSVQRVDSKLINHDIEFQGTGGASVAKSNWSKMIEMNKNARICFWLVSRNINYLFRNLVCDVVMTQMIYFLFQSITISDSTT